MEEGLTLSRAERRRTETLAADPRIRIALDDLDHHVDASNDKRDDTPSSCTPQTSRQENSPMAQPTVSTGTAGTTPASTADPVTVLLAEYAALKTEQNARIGARDHLVYATLTAIAAVVIGALQADMPILLLALPTVCAVLGWTRLTNDHKISAVGRYIHDDLAPTLNRLTGTPVLRWDAGYRTDNRADHRTDPHRNTRKRLQLGADLIAFLAGPGASFITGAVLDGGCLA